MRVETYVVLAGDGGDVNGSNGAETLLLLVLELQVDVGSAVSGTNQVLSRNGILHAEPNERE
jgi:hypothetical protein